MQMWPALKRMGNERNLIKRSRIFFGDIMWFFCEIQEWPIEQDFKPMNAQLMHVFLYLSILCNNFKEKFGNKRQLYILLNSFYLHFKQYQLDDFTGILVGAKFTLSNANIMWLGLLRKCLIIHQSFMI